MDKIVRNILIRQLPLIIASVVSGGILAYYLGFWVGIAVNTIAWGAAVVLAKMYVVRNGRDTDAIRNDRYLTHFVLALVGRYR